MSRVAERYHTLLEVGANGGVVPQVEVWRSSRALSRLLSGECDSVGSDT
jgi:hypothetical protein